MTKKQLYRIGSIVGTHILLSLFLWFVEPTPEWRELAVVIYALGVSIWVLLSFIVLAITVVTWNEWIDSIEDEK